MKRWVLALMGLVSALSGPVASAKELPTIDAFFEGAASPRAESRAQKEAEAKGVRIASFEPRTGVPSFVWGDGSSLDERLASALQRMSPEQAARVHLGRLAPLYQLAPQAAQTLPAVTRETGQGPILVIFHQRLGGIEVFRQSLTLLLNERRELIAASGYLSPHATAESRPGKQPFTMDATAAIARAYEDLTGQRVDLDSLEPTGVQQGPYTSFDLSEDSRARYPVRMMTPARAKQVFFPLADRLVPAWYLELHAGEEGKTSADYYAYVVSAEDGRVLFRNNLTVADAYTYRVWAEGPPNFIPQDGPQGLVGTPHPTGVPDGYQAPFVAPSLVNLQNVPFSQNDPWLPPGATETVGNNVDAYADISGTDGLNGTDFRANTTSPGTFDRIYNVLQEPGVTVDQQKAAVTHLFYVNNFLHDWYYDSGFNEAAGNAQTNNFGRGGLGSDSLRAEAQDFSGVDNANMSTPSDGARPRMQMYLFNPNPISSFTILSPPPIAAEYPIALAAFGPQVYNVTAPLVLVVDAGGASPSDGCETPFANAAQLSGKLAVIDRGTCNFTVKVKNAQDAGAVGVILVNNVAGPATPLGGTDATIVIPTMAVSQSDGTLIKAQLPNGPVTGRMFVEAAVFRDGSLDSAIVAHEWGHFISNRLVANSTGLVNNQGRSMGEGWGDFHALLMAVREADKQLPGNNNFQGTYGLGGYVMSGGGNNGYYYGLRRYPYSTDLAKNPLTFRHIQDGVVLPAGPPSNPELAGVRNAEVHNSGEVWASMLWECYTALLRDNTRLTFTQAQARMKIYLVLAYQVTPVAPTFIEARDALLAAAYALDPTDFRLFHAAFARRGAGLRAQGPSRGSLDHVAVTEGFSTGKDLELGQAELLESNGSCDADGVLDNKEAGVLRVRVFNTGTETLTQTTVRVATADAGFTFANGGLLTFPSIPPFASATADLTVSLDGPAGIRVATLNLTYEDAGQAIPGARTVPLRVRVNTDDLPSASKSDNVEANISPWSAASDPDLGEYLPWLRYEEEADVHYFYGVDAPFPTDIYLITPPLQVSPQPFTFSFSHRYAFEYDSAPTYYDGGVIELSNNGGATWTDIGAFISAGQGYVGPLASGGQNPLETRSAFSGVSPGYPAWQTTQVNLGTTYAGQVVRIRFRVGTDAAVASVGWDVDNVSFPTITNTPFPLLTAEQNPCVGNNPPVANAGPDQTVNELT
ncbi:myxosortase-dependent M36 family metallopeptidase, partial [Hyalangium sp.]|uniref:myxosortase-dependent M36 family metallopeptidase n=1 Tax=Hyalangium sp. TaxID=2028555 RepID=UPI002D6AEB2D